MNRADAGVTTTDVGDDKALSPDVLLKVEGLKKYFPITQGLLRSKIGDIKAVDDVSFDILRGETLGLVGESGSGKTTIGRCVVRLLSPSAGRIQFDGTDLTSLDGKALRSMRKDFQVVFQDPYASLNPRKSVGSIIGEPLIVHGLTSTKQDYQRRLRDLMEMVGLSSSMADRYPHEFSGGQRQRVGIARAIAAEPKFLLADEPISALDVSMQAQILNLLASLQRDLNLTYLFISHDLATVKEVTNRVAVMYLGKIMEITDAEELFRSPEHPYTKALLSAVPIPDPGLEAKRERVILHGEIPRPDNPPSGCVFRTRCPMAIEECSVAVPPLKEVRGGHQVACIRV
jgi:oligopeptide/dipeptide ABC transporter ATP-binding protein